LLKEITIAIQAFFKAHQLIIKKNNYKWLLLSGIIYALIFALGLWFFFTTSSRFTEALMERTNIKNWLQSSNAFLTFLFITSVIMFNWVLLIYYFSMFKYVYLIICSLVFSYLSLKTNNLLQNKPEEPVSNKTVLQLSKRALIIISKNILWQSLYFLVLIIASLIPVIGWIVPIIALLTECYYFGFSTVDYRLSKRDLSIVKSQQFIEKHKGLAIGNGLIFYILHLIPVLGWIAAPIYAVIAATVSVDQFEK
jgi:CysZ protein